MTVPVSVPVPAAAMGNCTAQPEWSSISGANVVGYSTPNPPSDTFLSNNLADPPAAGEPNVTYQEFDYDEGARYVSPATAFGNFYFDGSLLQTTVVETYVNPIPTSDGDRSITRNLAEPHDVDSYSSLDPTVEAVYTAAVAAPFADATGCAAMFLWDCALDVFGTGITALDTTAGPTFAQVFPLLPVEDTGYDYIAGTHPYFDVHVDVSGANPLVVIASDGSNGQLSGDANGEASAPVVMGVYGALGLWHDENQDGWVGAPTVTEGCADAHDCGTVADPNDYADSTEWTAYCRATDRPAGEILATLTSSTGVWGTTGVYILRDDSFFGLDQPGEQYENDTSGAVAGSPWDDIVLDAADTEVDNLVLSGAITLHLNCGGFNPPGEYHSWEKIVFPEGGNRGYDVRLETATFDTPVVTDGITVQEPIFDVDVVAAI